MVYRADEATIGFNGEGYFVSSTSATTKLYGLNQEHQTYGTVSTTTTEAAGDITFTDSSAEWIVDNLIGTKVKVWEDDTKAAYLGEGTVDDNTGTTLVVTELDFDTSPKDDAANYYEIDSFAMDAIQAYQTYDLGILFDGELELPNPEAEWFSLRAIDGTRDVNTFVQGKYESKSSMSGRLRVPRMLFYALGWDSVVDDEAGTYTHTLTGNSVIPSFVMESAYTTGSDFVRYFKGSKVNSLKITANTDDPMQAEMEVFTAIPEKTSNTVSTVVLDSNTGNYYSGDPYMFYQAGSGMSYLGNTYGCVTAFDFSITNNLTENYCLNATSSKYPASFTEGPREYELNATVRVSDSTMWDELMSPTTTSANRTVTLEFTRKTSYDTLKLECENCQMISAPHNIGEEGPIEVEVKLIPKTVTITSVDNKETYMVHYIA